MSDSDTLLSLIALAHDAALDSGLWARFLDAASDAMSGEGILIQSYSAREESGGAQLSARVDPHWIQRYNEYFARLNPWTLAQIAHWDRLRTGDLLVGQEYVPEADLVRTEFYNDICRATNTHHTVAGLLSKSGRQLSRLTVNRRRAGGPWTKRELAIWRVLTSHVKQALEVQGRLLEAETRQVASLDALDRLGYGVLFVERDGRVAHANRRGEGVLALDDGLCSVAGRLAAQRPSESRRLAKLIDSAARSATDPLRKPGGTTAVSRPSGKRPLIVQVCPLATRSKPVLGAHGPAVVFVTDPEDERLIPERHLRSVFGLTPREASVASLLAAGHSLAEIGEELGISVSTVRFYLKQVFSKTDTSRQGELVSLVLRLFGEEPTSHGEP